MRKRNVVFIILSSLFLATGFAACRHGHHPGGFDEFDLEAATNRIASKLDLDESQKVDLKAITAEIAARVQDAHADREMRHRELADLVRQETIQRDTVDRMIADKLDRMQDLALFAADRLMAFHATLTPEQREKVAEQIEAHAANRRGCFHH
jgi:Spy/CpxP family protein refolding chaperone